MKLNRILEGRVIQFKSKPRPNTDMDLSIPDRAREKVKLHFELLTDWIKEVKDDFRTPMMRGLDNIVNRLTMDIGFPHVNIENLGQFDQTDRAFLMSVSQNKSRILRLLQDIHEKIEHFSKSLPEVSAYTKIIKHLLEENAMYIELFEALAV